MTRLVVEIPEKFYDELQVQKRKQYLTSRAIVVRALAAAWGWEVDYTPSAPKPYDRPDGGATPHPYDRPPQPLEPKPYDKVEPAEEDKF